jgi:hypothetical protein
MAVKTTAFRAEDRGRVPVRHAGANGERMYRFYSFLTSALDGGEWSASRLGHVLASEKGHTVPIG